MRYCVIVGKVLMVVSVAVLLISGVPEFFLHQLILYCCNEQF